MSRMRPRVHTEKHILNVPIATVIAGASAPVEIAIAVAQPSTASEVREGASISAVYIELWIESDDANNAGSFNISFEKIQNLGNNMTGTQSFNLNTYVNKRNIFYTTQGLSPAQDNNPVPILRQWFKIPKGKQRQALGDKLNLNIATQAQGLQFCGLVIYKEQF